MLERYFKKTVFSVIFSAGVAVLACVVINSWVRTCQASSSSAKTNPKIRSVILYITYHSRIDNRYWSMKVKLPADFDPARKWPLMINIHGLGSSPLIVEDINSVIQLGIKTRASRLTQPELLEAVDFAKATFNIDDERVFLMGFSMGAFSTFEFGLKYPQIWAGCIAVCGRCDDLDWIKNGKNVAFWIFAGSKDRTVPAENSRKAYQKALKLGIKCWKYTENKDMGHSIDINWLGVEKWMQSLKRQEKTAKSER